MKEDALDFIRIITYKNGILKVKTTAASLVIDAVITTCFKTSAGIMTLLGTTLSIMKKSVKDELEKFFRKQMIPILTRGYINTFLTKTRKIFWSFVSKSTNVALEYAKEYTAERIYKFFKIDDIISIFSSWGSLLSMMLDISDGEKDDYIIIRRVKK